MIQKYIDLTVGILYIPFYLSLLLFDKITKPKISS